MEGAGFRDSDDTRLSDISRYFKRENKTKAYQASWVRNCMVSRTVWEHFGKPAMEHENTKNKNLKWEVNMVWVDRPKLILCCIQVH